MTINTMLMILALTVAGASADGTGGDTTTTSATRPGAKIESNCWINGVWYNPCPEDAPSGSPPPEIQPPG